MADASQIPKDDPEFIADAMGGDLCAFEQLVRHHQLSVRGFLAARMTNSNDAEDLAQEVFITAYRRRESFSGERPIGAWFRGIARNLLRNHLRKFRATPVGGNEELQSLIDADLDQVDDGGTLVALRECLTELDGPSRELVVARYLSGESVRQIAKKTGRGYSALTMQLHRIRNVLGECIERKLGHSTNS